MSDTIISVERLSKKYRLGQIGATTLRESAERLWHKFCGRNPDEAMATIGVYSRPPARNAAHPPTSLHKVFRAGNAAGGSAVTSSSASDALWALRDVSFEVKRGEVFDNYLWFLPLTW
ncbi:hypothetical protein ACFLS1_03670 [Verrucomicrobiota bacterium]